MLEQILTRERRNHSPEFKAKVTLAAAKGDKTITELTQQYKLHPKISQLTMEMIFQPKCPDVRPGTAQGGAEQN
ncbi:MAG: hypothetical protein CENE_02765 [Candidatus Celerinatantimonas neptuna]|nr:MAG: hypothetical protein CENE_02765 [Candidatus Celerinatantimonas neptuna]